MNFQMIDFQRINRYKRNQLINQSLKSMVSYIHLTLYSFCFMSVGFLTGSIDHIISYFVEDVYISETEQFFLFRFRSLGSILGYLLFKHIEKKQPRITKHKIIATGAIINVFFTIVLGKVNSYFWKGLALVILENFNFSIIAGTYICIFMVAERQTGRWVTFTYAVYGMGALLSPILFRQYQKEFVYLIALMYLAIGLLFLQFSNPDEQEQTQEQQKLSIEDKMFREAPRSFEIAIGLGLFLIAGIQSTISGWMPAYAVNTEQIKFKQATICRILFWGSSTGFRFIIAQMNLKNSSKLKILLTSLFNCCVLCLILYYSCKISLAVIFGSICFGLSCSALYPLILSISTEFKIKMKSEQISNVLVTPCFSSLAIIEATSLFMNFEMDKLFACLLVASGVLYLNTLWLFRKMTQLNESNQKEIEQTIQKIE